MNAISKQQCKDTDWSNAKEITNEQIAYAIYTYDFKLSDVPTIRLDSVNKELEKLKISHFQELQPDKIKNVLDAFPEDESYADYILCPELFQTEEEALLGLDILENLSKSEYRNMEEHHHVYKPASYTKELQRLQGAMQDAHDKYVKIGGSSKVFKKCINLLPIPNGKTPKQTATSFEDYIISEFTAIGTSKNIAKNIAASLYSIIK
jgi:hypothetical protein